MGVPIIRSAGNIRPTFAKVDYNLMMPIEDLQSMLSGAFTEGEVHLTSPQGDNNHFQCVIVSDQFEGKSMVERHQLVYQAMGDAMAEAVHAFALKTYTPSQWENKGAGS